MAAQFCSVVRNRRVDPESSFCKRRCTPRDKISAEPRASIAVQARLRERPVFRILLLRDQLRQFADARFVSGRHLSWRRLRCRDSRNTRTQDSKEDFRDYQQMLSESGPIRDGAEKALLEKVTALVESMLAVAYRRGLPWAVIEMHKTAAVGQA